MGDTTASAERIYAPAADVSTAVPDAADADECDDGTTDALGNHWWYAKYVSAANATCAACPARSAGNTASGCTAAVSSCAGDGNWISPVTCASATTATGNCGVYPTVTGIGDGRPKTADASVTAGAYASGSASTGTCSSAEYCPITVTYTGFTEIG